MEDEERALKAPADADKEGAPPLNGAGVKKEPGGLSPGSNGSKVRSREPSVSPGENKHRSGSGGTPTLGTDSTPKLSRKDSQKTAARGRSPQLFDHLPDATQESYGHFQVINDCLYGSKHMGSSEHDALDCDCAEEWRKYRPHRPGAARY